MACEEEFRDLCETIVERVYEALGSRLQDDEIIRLASDLALAILQRFRETEKPVPEMAGDAMEEFFQSRGIVGVGDQWRWLN